ncbi:processing peptidase [Hyphomicrobium denitrificans ATCC 51888]|uniref:Processing peptidase n=1 Tax=Hyphomicrobium denitrificans (strain ATCC 51888 / DSM 1869 / NCIMB 11706 / TK 0415) TaxID=582899 RepID=D8JT81_HYPDA|nr:pitrilysin family protein [Hyphomicrobium denitrificans]ADJ24399.1 processing peptidase [Hyphomicrobium denitrificans ATCC 51888]
MQILSRGIATAGRAVARHNIALTLAMVTSIALLSFTRPAAAMNIQQITSPGGIQAWLVEERSVPLISMRYAFDGGSSQDPEGKPGVANFITAMMDEGAGDLTSEEYQERVEDISMRMSYDDTKDSLYGSFETLSANRDKAVELLKLSVQKPRFDDDAVQRIRQQLVANIIYSDKDPTKVAMREWYAQAFAGHPYARPSSGTAETVSKINRDDLIAYHKRIFARDNLKIVAVGDITPAELGKLIDDVFGNLPAKAELMPVAKTEPTGGSQRVIEMGVPQSVAIFGLGAMPRKDPDFMAAFIINHILGGGGFSAKLMEEVREKRGLAYSVYSYVQPDKITSILVGSVATKNASMSESLDIIRNEMKKMAENGPTEADLDAAKSYLTGSYALRFDTNSKIASQLLGLMQEGFGPDYVENRNKMIDAVTLADAKRVAARLLKSNDLIVTVVGKPDGMKSEIPAAQSRVAAPTRG